MDTGAAQLEGYVPGQHQSPLLLVTPFPGMLRSMASTNAAFLTMSTWPPIPVTPGIGIVLVLRTYGLTFPGPAWGPARKKGVCAESRQGKGFQREEYRWRGCALWILTTPRSGNTEPWLICGVSRLKGVASQLPPNKWTKKETGHAHLRRLVMARLHSLASSKAPPPLSTHSPTGNRSLSSWKSSCSVLNQQLALNRVLRMWKHRKRVEVWRCTPCWHDAPIHLHTRPTQAHNLPLPCAPGPTTNHWAPPACARPAQAHRSATFIGLLGLLIGPPFMRTRITPLTPARFQWRIPCQMPFQPLYQAMQLSSPSNTTLQHAPSSAAARQT